MPCHLASAFALASAGMPCSSWRDATNAAKRSPRQCLQREGPPQGNAQALQDLEDVAALGHHLPCSSSPGSTTQRCFIPFVAVAPTPTVRHHSESLGRRALPWKLTANARDSLPEAPHPCLAGFSQSMSPKRCRTSPQCPPQRQDGLHLRKSLNIHIMAFQKIPDSNMALSRRVVESPRSPNPLAVSHIISSLSSVKLRRSSLTAAWRQEP